MHNSKVFELRKIVIFGLFSVIFSIFQVSGNKIHLFTKPYFEDFCARDIFLIALMSIITFLASVALFSIMENRFSNNVVSKNTIQGNKYRWFYSAIIFIGWLPWFLVFYPGGVGIDTLNSIRQAAGIIPIVNDNPVMHTISLIPFVKLGLYLGDMNIGIALYVFFQMVILSLILGSCLNKIIPKINNKIFRFLFVSFYAFNPVIAMFAITIIKDSHFSVFVFAFIVVILQIIETDGKFLENRKGIFIFVLVTFLVAFARVNGFLVISTGIITLVFTIIYGRKVKTNVRKPILLLFVIGLIMYGPLYDIIGISTPRATTEALGVPLQQICYTVVSGGKIDGEDMDYIENNILIKERIIAEYTPHTVDGIKFAKGYNTTAVNSSKIHFFKMWMNIMKNNKSAYLKAWLMETKGYYHIGLTTMPCVFYIADNEFGIQNEKLVDQIFGKPIQVTMDWFQSRFARMCSIGVMMTLIWFCVCCIIANQKYSYLVVCSPVLGIWVSLMIGTPIYGDFRYIYPAFLALPLIMIFAKESFQKS